MSNENYHVRVANDYTNEKVQMEVDVEGCVVKASIDPRYARKIAIRLLESAEEVEAVARNSARIEIAVEA